MLQSAWLGCTHKLNVTKLTDISHQRHMLFAMAARNLVTPAAEPILHNPTCIGDHKVVNPLSILRVLALKSHKWKVPILRNCEVSSWVLRRNINGGVLGRSFPIQESRTRYHEISWYA
jgi:hypothetical protein